MNRRRFRMALLPGLARRERKSVFSSPINAASLDTATLDVLQEEAVTLVKIGKKLPKVALFTSHEGTKLRIDPFTPS